MKKLFFVILLLFFFFGCVQFPLNVPENTAKKECINLCKTELVKGTDLSFGPCIGNPLTDYPDFVCDIAHNPRQEIDNQQENQCSFFREGKAKHFVELDESCNFIQDY